MSDKSEQQEQSADEWLDKAWRGERCYHYKVVAEKYHELKLAEQPTREQIELEVLKGILQRTLDTCNHEADPGDDDSLCHTAYGLVLERIEQLEGANESE